MPKLRVRTPRPLSNNASLCLGLLLALTSGCARTPEPVEAVIRLAWPQPHGVAPAATVMGGEQREAVPVALPYAAELCREPDAPAGGRLEIGLAAAAPTTEVSARLSVTDTHTSVSVHAGRWRDISIPLGNARCARIELDGPEGAVVQLSRPLHLQSGTLRPWVILYVVDTLRFDYTPYAGAPTGDAWRRIGADAVVFRQAMASSSWTRPSAATLLTGLGPSAHRVFDRQDRLPEGLPRLPRWLANAGFSTAAFTTNPNVRPEWGFLEGFDHFVDVRVRERTGGYDALEAALLAYVAAHSDRPLFLYVHDNQPHFPYHGSEAELARLADFSPPVTPVPGVDRARLEDATRNYAAEIVATGARIEALLSLMKQLGRYDDSVVIVVGDHGEEFGEHGGVLHGDTLYQEQLHVPLLVKASASAGWRGVVDIPVATESVPSTVLHLLGLAPPDAPSAPRLPAPGETPVPRLLFAELALAGQKVDAVLRWPLKYLRDAGGRERLFDLESDPGELRDLAATRPDDVAALREALEERRAETRSGLGVNCVAGERLAVVELTLVGVDGDAEALALEPSDVLATSGGVATARFQLRPAIPTRENHLPSPLELARAQADRDGLRAQVGPDAEIRLRVVSGAVRLEGPSARPLDRDRAWPAAVLRTAVAPRIPEPGSEAICRAAYVAPSTATVPDEALDPELLERLRELGYLEDDSPRTPPVWRPGVR